MDLNKVIQNNVDTFSKKTKECISMAKEMRIKSAPFLAKNKSVGVNFDTHHINTIINALNDQALFDIIAEKEVDFCLLKKSIEHNGKNDCYIYYNQIVPDNRKLTAEEAYLLAEKVSIYG